MLIFLVNDVRQVIEDGYPVLRLLLDGKPARLTIWQKRRWLIEHNAVFLGNDWEESTRVIIPANAANGQSVIVLKGFTDDAQVVELYRSFLLGIGERI